MQMMILMSYFMVILKIKYLLTSKILIMDISMFQLLVGDIKVMQELYKMTQKDSVRYHL